MTLSCPGILWVITAMAACLNASESAESLFTAWTKNPAGHANIPDVSWAGYRRSEAPLPEPAVVASVADHGAKPGDGQDDLPAFAAAIAAAAAKGGGAVLVPEGTWELDGILRIEADGVVVRGAGIGKTTLQFRKPLNAIQRLPELRGQTQWSWSGGLVWLGPANTWAADGSLSADKGHGTESWEEWRYGAQLGTVEAPAKAGARTIQLGAAAASLKPGQWIMLAWNNPADRSLVADMAGHPSVANSDLGWIGSLDRWPWPTQIASIDGPTVTLAQGLRMDIRAGWQVDAFAIDGLLREAGIEHLTIATTGFRSGLRHNTYPGWNGIYLNRCADCFVREVRIQDVDNGVIHAAAKNTTVTGLTVAGGPHHHATALRVKSHDNLIERFSIESSPMHGINTEALSTGNVWRKGRMAHGTFDSHRGMSFDLVRTDIEVVNDGRPGGANGAGPFLGRRCVHWNIRITGGNGEYINQPEQLSMGALVGVTGPSKDGVSFAMPGGDKGTIVADAGRIPPITDLFEAQLRWRLEQQEKTATKPPASAPRKPPVATAAKGPALKPDAKARWERALAERVRSALAARQRIDVDLGRMGGVSQAMSVSPTGSIAWRTTMGTIEQPVSALAPAARARLAAVVAGSDPAGAACAALFAGAAGNPAELDRWLTAAGSLATGVRTDLGIEPASK